MAGFQGSEMADNGKRIAFYAPLKPPDHPIPSGDRQMARMLMAALREAGHDVFLASRYISYSKRWQPEHFQARRDGAIAEAQRLIEDWHTNGGAPDLWFCYHPYDKSPDWLGLEISRQLGIAIINAEPCKTGQGPNGEWLPWRAAAQESIRLAAMNIVMTGGDRAYVSSFVAPQHLTMMPPFIDASLLEKSPLASDPWPAGGVRLATVGMMRPGAKLESYTVLAVALSQITDLDWSLAIAGGGPGMATVAELFAGLPAGRITFLGELPQDEAIWLLGEADVLAWPGCREAYGMVYLEAASQGTPAVALRNMGVPSVVIDGRTGLLAEPEADNGYASALWTLITDAGLRQKLSAGAREFALGERSLKAAAATLARIIATLPMTAGRADNA